MLITVFVEGKEMPTVLEIPPECDYDLLTQIIEGETTISASEQFIEFNGVQLWEGKLTDCGVGEEDLLVLR